MKRVVGAERDFAGALTKFWQKQTRAILRALRRHGTVGGADALFRPSEWQQPLRKLLHGELAHLAMLGGLTEWAAFGPDRKRQVDWTRSFVGGRVREPHPEALRLPTAVRDRIAAWLDHTVQLEHWAELNDQVKADLAAALKRGVDEGLNLRQTAELIEQALGFENRKRSERIARTETTGALNAGHQASRERLQELGLIRGKEWLAIIDNTTREDHRAASGQIVGAADDFKIGGERAAFPGDTRLSAGQRVHCRCTCLSVPSEDA